MHAPKFWNKPSSWQASLLYPLSKIWEFQTQNRLKRTGYPAKIPVISIGNVNLGGVGKTPLTQWLIPQLQALGLKPVVLMRGYKGEIEGPHHVQSTECAKAVGDEAILLSAYCDVIIAKDRKAGAQWAEQMGDVIVMDDAHQNPDVQKDFSILVVDSDMGFGNGKICPAGPLRESVQTALSRTDFVVSMGGGKKWPEIREKIAPLPYAQAQLAPIDMGINWRNRKVYAFAGIGRPEKFFQTLESLGADIVARRAFSDHQEIPFALLNRMENEAKSLLAQLVTTEKDAARLPQSKRGKILVLPVRLEVLEGDILGEIQKRIPFNIQK